jgi:hypothetical protein
MPRGHRLGGAHKCICLLYDSGMLKKNQEKGVWNRRIRGTDQRWLSVSCYSINRSLLDRLIRFLQMEIAFCLDRSLLQAYWLGNFPPSPYLFTNQKLCVPVFLSSCINNVLGHGIGALGHQALCLKILKIIFWSLKKILNIFLFLVDLKFISGIRIHGLYIHVK